MPRRMWVDFLLALAGIVMLFPFGWMAFVSLRPAGEVIVQLRDWTWRWEWSNYARVWQMLPLPKYFANTLLISVMSTVVGTAMAIGAAFAFTSFAFYGRKLAISLMIFTLFIPPDLMLIPNYITIARFGYIDSYTGIMLPLLLNAFTIFYLLQSFAAIPQEYRLVAQAEGCSPFVYLTRIVIPVTAQPIGALMLLKMIGVWNDYLWPLIITNSAEKRTLAVGLLAFGNEAGTNYQLLMTVSMYVVLPITILYFIMRKHILLALPRTHQFKS